MWEELYKAHGEALIRYCFGICQNWELAEDLSQECFLKAFQNQETLMALDPRQRRAWLYKTARNLVFDKLRRAKLENQTLPAFQEDAAEDEAGFGTTEMNLLLYQLPPLERTLFRMRYLEGYTAAQLADIFDQPAGTIRSTLQRTRKKLYAMLMES